MESGWIPSVTGKLLFYLSKAISESSLKIVLGVPAYGHSYYVTTSAALDSSGDLIAYPPFNNSKQPAGPGDVGWTSSTTSTISSTTSTTPSTTSSSPTPSKHSYPLSLASA